MPVPSTPDTVVWLIRHGASTFNLEGRCQGASDVPEITDDGCEASRRSGERLRSAGVDVVISSPLRRAAQTAVEIRRVLGRQEIPHETDPRLCEIDLPEWQGLPFVEIRRRFPEQFLKWKIQPGDLEMLSRGGAAEFPVRKLYERAQSFWEDALARHAGRTILLVTHGGTGRALITTALGLGPEYFHRLQQSNCGISRLRFSPGEPYAKLDLLNDTTHFDLRLPKLKEGKTGVCLLLIPALEPSEMYLERMTSVLEGANVFEVFAVRSSGRRAASRIFRSRSTGSIQHVPEQALPMFIRAGVDQGNGSSVLHLALVAPPVCLRGVIRQQFALTASAAEQMVFSRTGISVVHSVGDGKPPVLQAMNMFETESCWAGASS
jgi:probable phosphoglycerate mutase